MFEKFLFHVKHFAELGRILFHVKHFVKTTPRIVSRETKTAKSDTLDGLTL